MTLLDVMNAPWAITPEKFVQIQEIYHRHLRGERLSTEQIEAKIGPLLKQEPTRFTIEDGVALIPVVGVIAKRMNLFLRFSGGTSTELVARDIREAVDNAEVRAIVLQIDSPGGTVDGTQELANLVFETRNQKPIVAYSDGIMASAALWIGAAAHQIVISGPTVEVGSIGVVATHVDVSRAEEMRGYKTTEIVSSKLKRATSPYKPLSESGEQVLQETVNGLHEIFVGEIAKFRNKTVEDVQTKMADGRVFLGQQAIEIGLVDSMFTLDQLLGKLTRSPKTTSQKENGMEKENMTAEQFAQANPEAVEAWKKEGFNAGYKKGLEDGVKSGAETERSRIKAVADQAKGFPGHETLVEEMMFDGQTTGDQAAAKILKAERKDRQAKVAALDEDAPTPVSGTYTTKEPEGATGNGEEAFNKAIEDYEKQHNCSYAEALVEVSKRKEFAPHA